ncbi:hypothetical protein [uncultured Phascolarctobacterium sp.]|uniref:hypothetical protein n=1 Tax=uncultured Phascolarctobacterium sp. TaxID=512296 RepID=UPI0025E7AC77|nr:hypothetical protein [uncultured Phascolarctobacterium sp.]
MATISKNILKSGFCKVDNDRVSIPIEYISFPDERSTKMNMTFIRNSNKCRYLSEGKCSMGRECQIYKDAEEQIELDISDMKC